MARAVQEKYGESLDIVIPRLMREFRTPYLVAVQLGSYPNAVRNWLLNHGWANQDGQWIAPAQQVEPQP